MWNTGLKNNASLIYTPGEPAGIGPDLIIQLAQQPLDVPVLVIANKALLTQRAQQLGLPITLQDQHDDRPLHALPPANLWIQDVGLATTCQPGQLEPANAPYVLECLSRAVDLCLKDETRALVTGPIHKGNINDAGIPFTGHTEYLAQLSATERTVMMLATTGLRVALATTHLPLRDVADRLTKELLEQTLTILHTDLINKFGMATPRITVCGLNPHAGESGHLGREELDVIIPVLDRLRETGMQLTGPIPADTAFTPDRMAHCDAFVCMYHDQGLPVLKHIGFGNAINITLGLPFIRTSVDHGTALTLAGRGDAHTGSLSAAMRMAQTMLSNQR